MRNQLYKHFLLLSVIIAPCVYNIALGSILFEDNFDSYTDGDLAGQGGWTTAAGNASDFTISGGELLIAGSDGSGIIQTPSFTSSTSLYYGFDLTITTVNTSGGRPSFARSGTNRAVTNIRDWNSGTEFDIANNSGAQIPYDGSTTYRLVAQYVSGTSATYWIGSSGLDEGTPYYSTTSGGGAQSFIQLLAPAAGTFVATIDNLVVSTTFNAAAIPEPSTFALLGIVLGAFGLSRLRNRRK